MSETQNNNNNPLAELDMLEMDDLFGEAKSASSAAAGQGIGRATRRHEARSAADAQTAAFRPLDENDADQCDDDHEVNYEQYGLHGMSILPNRGKINEVGGSLHERNGQ